MAQATLYTFRHTAEKISRDDLELWLNEWAKFWVYQIEQGDSGYIHYQGALCLMKKRRPQEIKNVMRKDDGFLPEYFEPMCSNEAKTIKTVEALADTYAAKKDTRLEGPFQSENVRKPVYISPQYANKEFRPWQRQVYNIIEREQKTLNTRNIHWVYDWWGNHGKSVLIHKMRLEGKALVLPTMNDHKEIVQAFCDMCMDRNIREPGGVFIDLPRAFPQKEMKGFASAMESIKDGYITECRNHFRDWDIKSPSIWMFANSAPPEGAFSADRLWIWMFSSPGPDATLVRYLPGAENTIVPGYQAYNSAAAQDAAAAEALVGPNL